jgi:hypothetical protein
MITTATPGVEKFVYLNGKFWDRVSTKPEQVARSLDAKIVSVSRFIHPVCGTSWKVELSK